MGVGSNTEPRGRRRSLRTSQSSSANKTKTAPSLAPQKPVQRRLVILLIRLNFVSGKRGENPAKRTPSEMAKQLRRGEREGLLASPRADYPSARFCAFVDELCTKNPVVKRFASTVRIPFIVGPPPRKDWS